MSGFGAPQAKRRSRVGWWVAGGVVAVVVVAAAVGGGGDDKNAEQGTQQEVQSSSGDSLDHREDVKITECANDEYGAVAAKVVITNHSSKPSTYNITVAFTTADGTQVTTGYASADQLAAGQSSTPQPVVTGQTHDGSFSCSVADAMRVASG